MSRQDLGLNSETGAGDRVWPTLQVCSPRQLSLSVLWVSKDPSSLPSTPLLLESRMKAKQAQPRDDAFTNLM